MDLWYFLDIQFILLFIVLFIVTYMYLTWPFNYFKKLGVPGPTFVSQLEAYKDLLTKKKTHNQQAAEMVTKYGKVFGFFEGWIPVVMVADPVVIKDIAVKLSSSFTDRRHLLMRGPLKYSAFDQRGDNWKRIRSLCTPLFTPGRLRKSSMRINAVLTGVMQYLDEQWHKKAELEAAALGSSFTMDGICSVVFGVDTNTLNEKEHPLTTNARKLVLDFGLTNPWFLLPYLCPSIAHFLDSFDVSMFKTGPSEYIIRLCRTLLQQKEQENNVMYGSVTFSQETQQEAGSFVTALFKAHKEFDPKTKQTLGKTGNVKYKGMSEKEIIGQAVLFVFAAYDTTSRTLGFLLHALTLDQSIQQTLYEEIQDHVGDQPVTYDNVQNLEYLNWCVNETLRMYPPIRRIERQCTTNDGVTVGGVPLKKGHLVIVPVMYVHYQPDIWPEPNKFDPLRFSPEIKQNRHPYNYLPFGVGPRNCFGGRMALMKIKMFIVTVLQQFKLIPNSKTVPVDLDLTKTFTEAKDGLWFSLEKRQ